MTNEEEAKAIKLARKFGLEANVHCFGNGT